MKRKSIKYTDLLLEELQQNLNEDEVIDEGACHYGDILAYIKENKDVDTEKVLALGYECGMDETETLHFVCGALHNAMKNMTLDEMMSTGTAAGGMEYATPAAFSGTHSTSNKIKKISTMLGMKPVGKTNRWFKKMDKDTGKPINENKELDVDFSLYKRMMKSVNGDI